ncbi:hypothetical protein QFZ20_004593 [Flavobacterium sp. W4I14]|nr:hypothetical protein [Flavobacterium sp. W4I14]
MSQIELNKSIIELKWTITVVGSGARAWVCGGLLKGSITVSGGAILRKQAMALPFR